MRRFAVFAGKVILAIGSGYFTWYIYVHYGASLLGFNDPQTMAIIVIVSLFVHEMGHAISFGRHGVPSLIFFLVFLGGAVPLDIKKADSLSDNAAAEVYLAGLMGNSLVILVAMLSWKIGLLSGDLAERTINLNGTLMLFNMLPFAIFDGSRFVKVLFHNISKDYWLKIFEVTSFPVIVGMMLMVYYRGSVGFTMPLLLFGLVRSRNHTDGVGHPTKPMTRAQRALWAVIFSYLVIIGLAAFMLTKDWNHAVKV